MRLPCLPILHAFLIWTAAACALSPKLTQWERDFYYSEKLYIDGQNELAAKRFARLRATATDPRDADEAALLECESQARGGLHAQGAACYDLLATAAIDKPMRMRALLHAGELRYYELRKANDAVVLWLALVERAPYEPATLRALDHLYLHGERDRSKRQAMISQFLALEARDPRSEIADNLLLRAAMLLDLEGTTAAWQQAVDLLEREERSHPEDATYVDCVMTRARIYRKLGALQLEARELERLVNTFETSYVFASYTYEEQRLASARLIELYRGPLLNLPRAEHHARNLPAMLRRPLHMPRYLVTLAEVQEAKGERLAAMATYREILSFVLWRAKDFKDNDHRICSELPTGAERSACKQEVDSYAAIEPKECAVARERIERLQGELRRPNLGQPSSRKPGGS